MIFYRALNRHPPKVIPWSRGACCSLQVHDLLLILTFRHCSGHDVIPHVYSNLQEGWNNISKDGSILLLLCSLGRHSVSIHPTAVKECTPCCGEKRFLSPPTCHIYSAQTRPSYCMVSHARLKTFLTFCTLTFFPPIGKNMYVKIYMSVTYVVHLSLGTVSHLNGAIYVN